MNKKVKTKYFNFIQDCYNHRTFDKMVLRDVHKVGFTLLRAMANTNAISTSGGVTTWTGPQLSQSLVQEIYNEYNHLKRLEAKKLRAKRAAPQLTIKPVRKAPAPAPMSVTAEPECDTTNSKMMLILGAGLLIGFMIATIIWK
jgi:hypothetical protein